VTPHRPKAKIVNFSVLIFTFSSPTVPAKAGAPATTWRFEQLHEQELRQRHLRQKLQQMTQTQGLWPHQFDERVTELGVIPKTENRSPNFGESRAKGAALPAQRGLESAADGAVVIDASS
jgi:hypothetical protein